jgi:hypothetical protein
MCEAYWLSVQRDTGFHRSRAMTSWRRHTGRTDAVFDREALLEASTYACPGGDQRARRRRTNEAKVGQKSCLARPAKE